MSRKSEIDRKKKLLAEIKAGKKVGLVPKPIYFYRVHSDRIGVIKKRPELKERKHFESKIVGTEVNRLNSLDRK